VGIRVCGVAVLSEKSFMQLRLLFDVFPTLCYMSVNGVVARIPVVRNLFVQCQLPLSWTRLFSVIECYNTTVKF